MSSDDFTREPLGIGSRVKELDRQLKAADREALGNISAGLAQAISERDAAEKEAARLREENERLRAWAKDEQEKRHAAEDARVEARSEAARLRAWLGAMVDENGGAGGPMDCGWCVELRGWAVEALAGTPFDPAAVRDEL